MEYCQVRCIGVSDSAGARHRIGGSEMEQKLYGFVGEIARINLTTQAVSYVETAQYVPEVFGRTGYLHQNLLG